MSLGSDDDTDEEDERFRVFFEGFWASFGSFGGSFGLSLVESFGVSFWGLDGRSALFSLCLDSFLTSFLSLSGFLASDLAGFSEVCFFERGLRSVSEEEFEESELLEDDEDLDEDEELEDPDEEELEERLRLFLLDFTALSVFVGADCSVLGFFGDWRFELDDVRFGLEGFTI